MPLKKKELFANHLAEIRRSKHLDKEDVASLLGHENTTRISRIEQGQKVPDLKTALKLAQIYNMPIRTMLDEYYIACRREMEKEKGRLEIDLKKISMEAARVAGFCSYDQLLSSPARSEADVLKVRQHVAYLVRKSAEMLGHF